LDCAGYSIGGAGTGYGIYLNSQKDTVIQGCTIHIFSYGVHMDYSPDNVFIDNEISDNNGYGLNIAYSHNNEILSNTISSNGWNGIRMIGAQGNLIKSNTITLNNYSGIDIDEGSNNILTENTFSFNIGPGPVVAYGVAIYSSDNYIYHNNFINNEFNVYEYPALSQWDDNYPSGGNYWSDYIGVDLYSGPNQDQFGSDGIGDTPYTIHLFTAGQDRYPFIEENGWEEQLGQDPADLAKQLANHPEAYLFGGKGWDFSLSEFVPSASILSGYTYWNSELEALDTGIGVDCSGLITWAFNRTVDPLTPATDNFVKYVNADGLHRDYQSDAIAESELLPGDAMFFDWNGDEYIDHSAMYVGEDDGFDVVNAKSKEDGIVMEIKNSYKLIPGFIAFRRIHEGIKETEIKASSPVNLRVTDPDGFTITPDSVIPSDEEYIREVPGVLYYSEIEQAGDGNPVDRIYSPFLKPGDYLITVLPAPEAQLADTYTLEFITAEQSITLTEDHPILNIPEQPYVVRVQDGEVEEIIPMRVRIEPETLNLSSRGILTIFLQIDSGFGVSIGNIDMHSLLLAGAQPTSSVYVMGKNELKLKFNIQDLQDVASGDSVDLTLKGNLLDGTKIEGSDTVRVIRKGRFMTLLLNTFHGLFAFLSL
jgi:parallel beta-helix repeat protein